MIDSLDGAGKRQPRPLNVGVFSGGGDALGRTQQCYSVEQIELHLTRVETVEDRNC